MTGKVIRGCYSEGASKPKGDKENLSFINQGRFHHQPDENSIIDHGSVWLKNVLKVKQQMVINSSEE